MEFVYQIHTNIVNNRIMLVYEGEVNQDITKAFTTRALMNFKGLPTFQEKRNH